MGRGGPSRSTPGRAPGLHPHPVGTEEHGERGTKGDTTTRGWAGRQRACKARVTQNGTGRAPPAPGSCGAARAQLLLWIRGVARSGDCPCSGHSGCTAGRQHQQLPFALSPGPGAPRAPHGAARENQSSPEPRPARALRSHPEERGHRSRAGTEGTSRRRLSTAPARESSRTLALLSSFCAPEISSSPGQLHM